MSSDTKCATEIIMCLAIHTIICIALSWLFYDSLYGPLLFAPFFPLLKKTVTAIRQRKYRERFAEGFLRALVSVSASVSAGMAPENAFAAAAEDMEKTYGKKEPVVRELQVINSKMAAGGRITDALLELAKKTQISEIYDFGVVFKVAVENGSDLGEVISACGSVMQSGRFAENEARVLIRAKQYEQRVMFAIFPGILLYLRISSGNYMDILYTFPFGTAVMTCALALFVLAVYIGEKTGDIRI